ncbi:hypothetical protein K2173_014061 [Erythroxylum novogranatense]|uniref:BHLH domain-containing protein n=1 Tax=Erythroxylum novogranatense TaxID=1862640 RepID=A0AAV8SD42_9ROSI|nr:hypothetical protein K2173_014061 [Erythroxylum novogranatense]
MNRIVEASAGNCLVNTTSDYELHDFIDEANFDHFIDLIRGGNEDQISGFDCDLLDGFLVENEFGQTPEDAFGFNASSTMMSDANPATVTLPSFPKDMKGGEEEDGGEEENDGEEESSGTTNGTTTTTPRSKTKPDRSRALISERSRRGRMKEKLYALRSLVPNITKMDKASIIGDAVFHVQDLQRQAKKLKNEISRLEASLADSERYRGTTTTNKILTGQVCKKIIQMEVFQVEERVFYVRLVCNKGEGVAISLCCALESLTNFDLQSSTLATTSDTFVFTFTLNGQESEVVMSLPNLKLWITGALLNHGFENLNFLSVYCPHHLEPEPLLRIINLCWN